MAQLLANPNPCAFHPCTPSTPRRPRLTLPHRSLKISVSVHRRALLIGVMQPATLNDTQRSIRNIKATNPDPVRSSGSIIPLPSIPVWAKWVLGAIVCLAVPFYKKILRIEDAVENAAETVVETIEKVAEVTGKVAADVVEALPDGKLKQEALQIENIAEAAQKDAEKAEEIIHKVEEVRKEVKTVVEPIVEKVEIIEKEIEEHREAQEENAGSPSTDSPKASGEGGDSQIAEKNEGNVAS